MNARNFPAFVAAVLAASACGSSYSSATVQSTTYVAALSGANERPNPTTSTGMGTATYTLTGKSLSYVITLTSALTGPATFSHIHGPAAASASAGVIVPFTINNVAIGALAQGTIDLNVPITVGSSTVTGDSLIVLLNAGLAYTNVHTAAFGAGEIRGQILKQ